MQMMDQQLSAIAEDTHFPIIAAAERVAERIKVYDSQYQEQTTLANARELLELLESEMASATGS